MKQGENTGVITPAQAIPMETFYLSVSSGSLLQSVSSSPGAPYNCLQTGWIPKPNGKTAQSNALSDIQIWNLFFSKKEKRKENNYFNSDDHFLRIYVLGQQVDNLIPSTNARFNRKTMAYI